MEDIKELNNLLDTVTTISKSYEILSRSTGEYFNIFSILRMEYDENAMHSRFISELLNKKGSHQQGNAFLELFCEQFSIDNFDFDNYDVITEYSIGRVSEDYMNGGRIDIFIKDTSANVIMIENKIYADEQKYQLYRYKNAFPNGKLIFLTLYGNESSCEEAKNIDYTAISYSSDIINWLENCKKFAIDTPMLREVISQYIYLIKKITNQNSNKEMSKEIIRQILNNKEKLNSFMYLNCIENELYKEVFKNHFIDVAKNIAIEKNMKFHLDDNFLNGQRYNGFNIENEKLINLNLNIRFDFEGTNFRAPLYGLAHINNDKAKDFDYTNYIEKFDNIFPNSVSNVNFACFYYTNENWRSFEKLEEILFGNFKIELTDKLNRLFDIFK